MYKICAIIPAYDEGLNIVSVIKQVKKHNIDIVVIDDGSTDQTAALAEREEVCLIRHISNEGKGSALRRGFQFAVEKDYDYVITLDADGQHNSDEIPLFIDKIGNSNEDIVVGNRLHSPKGMPVLRLFVNKLFSKIVAMVSEQNIPDALCGYRIITRQILKSITLSSNRFDIDPEILIKASKKGFKITSVNIECIYANEFSYIRPLQDGYLFFRLIIKELKNS